MAELEGGGCLRIWQIEDTTQACPVFSLDSPGLFLICWECEKICCLTGMFGKNPWKGTGWNMKIPLHQRAKFSALSWTMSFFNATFVFKSWATRKRQAPEAR